MGFTITTPRVLPTITGLLLLLGNHFWEKIERHNPDQPDLRIAPDTYTTWREQINTRDDGRPAPRSTPSSSPPSFYRNLHTWAAEEPERWAPGSHHAQSHRTGQAASATAAAGSTNAPPNAHRQVEAARSYRRDADPQARRRPRRRRRPQCQPAILNLLCAAEELMEDDDFDSSPAPPDGSPAVRPVTVADIRATGDTASARVTAPRSRT